VAVSTAFCSESAFPIGFFVNYVGVDVQHDFKYAVMPERHFLTCFICEAMCGLVIMTEGASITDILSR
jgi:hypothetical protein